MTKPQNLFGVVWMGFTPLKQPRKLTLGVFQNLLSNSVNSESLFYCLLDMAWASWLEQWAFKIYWVTQYTSKMSPFDLRQHCRLTIWNNWLSRQIAVSVSDVKIQITLLILGRGALSSNLHSPPLQDTYILQLLPATWTPQLFSHYLHSSRWVKRGRGVTGRWTWRDSYLR